MIRIVKLKLRNRRYEALAATLYLCQQLYNAALQERREAWAKQHKSLSFFDQCKELTQVRADELTYRNLDVTMAAKAAEDPTVKSGNCAHA